MSRILLIEDSVFFRNALRGNLETRLGVEVDCAGDYASARAMLGEHGDRHELALVDLTLPDCGMGDAVDLVLAAGLPAVVLTGDASDEVRALCWSKGIADYVVKKCAHNFDYLAGLARRILRNPAVKVLVVDDSRTARANVAGLLRMHRYQVLEADSGQAALDLAELHPDLRLAIVDYHMPRMHGVELAEALRRLRPKDELAIIGVSAQEDPRIPARFIKAGANDFLYKPFTPEEFYCRVNHNVDLLEHIATIRELSTTDFLTKLHNRRFFFESGAKLFSAAKRAGTPLAVAMLDIDHFKRVNDTHGHDAGDAVLASVAALLKERFRTSDLLARFGGEEFCVLAPNMEPGQAGPIFEAVRQAVADAPIPCGGKQVRVTLSIGVCQDTLETLDHMLSAADRLLYLAKQGGRDRVVLSGQGLL